MATGRPSSRWTASPSSPRRSLRSSRTPPTPACASPPATGSSVAAAGFTDSDPTGTAALDPTRRQMRAAVHRAVTLILRAEDELQEAGSVIANGYLRLDREEWIRVVEKRSAALAGPPVRRSGSSAG